MSDHECCRCEACTERTKREAMCSLLSRLGADGACSFWSGATAAQLEDEVYSTVRWLEARQNIEAAHTLTEKARRLGYFDDDEAGEACQPTTAHASLPNNADPL